MGLGVSKSQGLGIYYRNNFICPTEDEYIEFASGRKYNYLHHFKITYGILLQNLILCLHL
jgi:hypothetical protein